MTDARDADASDPTSGRPSTPDAPNAPALAPAAAAPADVNPFAASSALPDPLEPDWSPFADDEARRRAWRGMLFRDHGLMRLASYNLHRVGAHAWRSAQPAPHQIGRLARRGIKTIVNLRGGDNFGAFDLEREACARHGVALVKMRLRSRAAPLVLQIDAVDKMLRRIDYPALFHCKAGADRVGLMSALYLLLYENAPVETALRQLSLRYLHIRQGRTGVLDAVLETYQSDAAAARAQGETLDFRTWTHTLYDPKAIETAFFSRRWGRFLVDRVLRRE